MCLYPRFIYNPKYKKNKKNGGNIPPFSDKRVLVIPIGCGNCLLCRKKKANSWRNRLIEECKNDLTGVFVTLTFNSESLKDLFKDINIKEQSEIIGCKTRRTKNGYRCRYIYQVKKLNYELKGYDTDNAICKRAVRLFCERWRKITGKSPKHWLITELGGGHSEHVHLHGIIWTDKRKMIKRCWDFGFVWDGYQFRKNYVNARTANYITKYMFKVDKNHPNYKPIVLCSKGIGSCYADNRKVDSYRLDNGKKVALPTYWKNKMYNDEEREQMWIKLLDENVRYINGKKFAGDDIEGIFNEMQYMREINEKLGFISEIDEKHELQYRNLINKKLI